MTQSVDPKVRALFEQIAKLPNHEKLQLAAGLLEKGQVRLAKSILDRVSVELGVQLLQEHVRDRVER